MPQFQISVEIVSEPATNRWFFVSRLVCCSCCSLRWSMLLNLKTIANNGLEIGSAFQDGSVHLTVTPYMIVTVIVSAAGLCDCCLFIPQIPV